MGNDVILLTKFDRGGNCSPQVFFRSDVGIEGMIGILDQRLVPKYIRIVHELVDLLFSSAD